MPRLWKGGEDPAAYDSVPHPSCSNSGNESDREEQPKEKFWDLTKIVLVVFWMVFIVFIGYLNGRKNQGLDKAKPEQSSVQSTEEKTPAPAVKPKKQEQKTGPEKTAQSQQSSPHGIKFFIKDDAQVIQNWQREMNRSTYRSRMNEDQRYQQEKQRDGEGPRGDMQRAAERGLFK